MHRLNISYKQFYVTLNEIWLFESDPNAPSTWSEPGGKQWQRSIRGRRNWDVELGPCAVIRHLCSVAFVWETKQPQADNSRSLIDRQVSCYALIIVVFILISYTLLSHEKKCWSPLHSKHFKCWLYKWKYCQIWGRKYLVLVDQMVEHLVWIWRLYVQVTYGAMHFSSSKLCFSKTSNNKKFMFLEVTSWYFRSELFNPKYLCLIHFFPANLFPCPWCICVQPLVVDSNGRIADARDQICEYPLLHLDGMMTSWHGNTFHNTGPLWGESTVSSVFLLTKASIGDLWGFLLLTRTIFSTD